MSLPQPSDEFEWVQESWGAALRCRPLTEVAPHYFSTRQDMPERTLATALGVELQDFVRMKQVHGADVFAASGRPPSAPTADIAVTRDSTIALSVRTADCVPILLADVRSGAVGAVHAGWKGTAAGAVIAAVASLGSNYGTRPADVIAAVGPSIGPCCYEVGPELRAHFAGHAAGAGWFTNAEKPHLDLWRATRDQLAHSGVPPQQIHLCRLCTFDHQPLFHSFRRDAASAGRLVAAIRSARGTTP